MRLLIVSFWCPEPPDNGSRLRAYHLIQRLAGLGYQIKLLALAQQETDIPVARQRLARLCSRGVDLFPSRFFKPTTAKALAGFLSPLPRHLLDTHQPAFAAAVAQECRSGDHDAVMAMQLGAAHYVPAGVPVPCILDEVEISPFVKAVEAARAFHQRCRRSLTLAKQKSLLVSLGTRYARWTAVSAAETDVIGALIGNHAPPIQVLPNGVDLVHNSYEAGFPYDEDKLVYNGSVTFSANADAVRWFVDAVLPLIQMERPKTCLSVTGRTTDATVEEFSGHAPGVMMTGFLDDVRPAIRSAAVCVVPQREGGGTRLKILEAMALGIPVVSTSRGAEGIEASPGTDILIADTPAAFAEATLIVMNNPARRLAIGEAGRRLVEERYGWDAIAEQLHRTFQEVALPRSR